MTDLFAVVADRIKARISIMSSLIAVSTSLALSFVAEVD